jgi:hypothetical protein
MPNRHDDRMGKPSDPAQVHQQIKVLWYSAWFDVALGVAALLWGDLLFPPAMPSVLGVSMGTVIGLAFLLFAAPAMFGLYYYRRRQAPPLRPAARAPIEKL